MLKNLAQESTIGLIPRFIKAIFKKKSQNFTISCSFIQIEHEEVYDLLPYDVTTERKDNFISPLKMSNDKKIQNASNEIEGLQSYIVNSEIECLNLLRLGERNRLMSMRQRDSQGLRSTSLFQIQLQSVDTSSARKGSCTKFNFCDLACSNPISEQEKQEVKHFIDF